jgi:hypothetical protein
MTIRQQLLHCLRWRGFLPSRPHLTMMSCWLFTDGEDPQPRFGASGFAEYHPAFNEVALAVNFEGIGIAGASMLVEISRPEGGLITHLADAVPDPVVYPDGRPHRRGSDRFDIFRDAGVPERSFTYMHGTSIYDTPSDSIAKLYVDGLAHHRALITSIVS